MHGIDTAVGSSTWVGRCAKQRPMRIVTSQLLALLAWQENLEPPVSLGRTG